MALANLGDVRLVDLPRHQRADGEVVVAESAVQVPFAIARMFTVKGPAGAVRGEHAHRRCAQFMLCVHGAFDIDCTDGHGRRAYSLDRGNRALLVPPTIWNTVSIRADDSVLVVLCDRLYEEHDYIRDRSEFIAFRKAKPA
jgi:dTDP-4-dehydrorhamnose 3,5-epimerase-like enzyme